MDTSLDASLIEANILADVFEKVRGLTKFYLMRSAEIDSFKRWEVNGAELNSRYWLMGHIVWAEHFLLVHGVGGKTMDIPWLDKFEIAATPPAGDDLPSLQEISKRMDEVHTEAMKIIRSTTSEELDKPNHIELDFRGDDSKRMMLQHAIRHEPCHSGHLGWLCKINGVGTF